MYPTDNGIGAVFGVTVAASSPADETDVNDRLASRITPSGNLGTSGLSIVGPLSKTREIAIAIVVHDSFLFNYLVLVKWLIKIAPTLFCFIFLCL